MPKPLKPPGEEAARISDGEYVLMERLDYIIELLERMTDPKYMPVLMLVDHGQGMRWEWTYPDEVQP